MYKSCTPYSEGFQIWYPGTGPNTLDPKVCLICVNTVCRSVRLETVVSSTVYVYSGTDRIRYENYRTMPLGSISLFVLKSDSVTFSDGFLPVWSLNAMWRGLQNVLLPSIFFALKLYMVAVFHGVCVVQFQTPAVCGSLVGGEGVASSCLYLCLETQRGLCPLTMGLRD